MQLIIRNALFDLYVLSVLGAACQVRDGRVGSWSGLAVIS